MYRVLINKTLNRILVTGKERDLCLLDEGWEIVYEATDWEEAFEYAMEIADDEIIEWYYDEAVRKKIPVLAFA